MIPTGWESEVPCSVSGGLEDTGDGVDAIFNSFIKCLGSERSLRRDPNCLVLRESKFAGFTHK